MKDEAAVLIAIEAVTRAIRGAKMVGDWKAVERHTEKLKALEWCAELDTDLANNFGEYVEKAAILIAEHNAKRNARLN